MYVFMCVMRCNGVYHRIVTRWSPYFVFVFFLFDQALS